MFGADLPAFNLKGKTQVLTKTGSCLSLVVMMVFLTYGVLKFMQMIEKHNPFISEMTEKNIYDYNTQAQLERSQLQDGFQC